MAYLVLKGDSYNRTVSLTNACNKPRIACKNGNGTSYIPVGGEAGNKNLRVSNSYMDIRQSTTYNTTKTSYTDTIQQIYTSRQSDITSSSLGNFYQITTTNYITSSDYNAGYTASTATTSYVKSGMNYVSGTYSYRFGVSDQYTVTGTFERNYGYLSGSRFVTYHSYSTIHTDVYVYPYNYYTGYTYQTFYTYTYTHRPDSPYARSYIVTVTTWQEHPVWYYSAGRTTTTNTRSTVTYNTTTQSWYYSNKATTTGTTINTTTYSYY